MTRTRRTLLALLLLAVAAAAWLWAYSRLALPRTDGSLALPGDVPGPAAEVRIERDANGIPTIRAGSMEDAMFGLGFVHAQDRLWQLETHRRIGAGRLAEAFGEAAVDTDRFLRALGVRRAAAEQWAQTNSVTRGALTAYAAGINAQLRLMRARPPEFMLLGIRPEDWDPVDSLAWSIMMAWDLGANWSTELLRMQLALTLPVDRINELLPPYPGEQPLASADYGALFRALGVDGRLGRHALQAAPPSGVQGIGSNNWVLAGSRTESGRPLLGNDPHLRLSAPSLWYLARIEAPDFKVAGATIPGLPMVVLGQNEHVAWGYTNTGPDVQDVYLERIDPSDPRRYQTPDGWAPFDTETQTIQVRNGADVPITVRRTRHGPVISDAGPGQGLTGPATRPAYALALRWTALDPSPGTIDAGIAVNRARSVDAFVAATAANVAPMQNMVVADRDGHIGMVAAGRVPLRRPEHDLKGLVPAPGWEARYDWYGYLPAGATPRETDPARGYIATANQRIHGPDYPHFLTSEWAPPYRQQRIEQLLQANGKHTLDSMAAMQGDELSLAVAPMLPWLREAASTHPLADAARARFAAFDGRMDAGRAEPLVFWAWTRQLTHAVFADEIGEATWRSTIGTRNYHEALEGVLARNDGWWCDDKTTAAAETCAEQAALALTRALDELQQAYGADIGTWQWGRAHVARSTHRPFSQVGALARWFELRTPVGGDTYTLNVGRVRLDADSRTGERYLDEHGPGFRGLYDLGDPARSRVMQSTGQSGIVYSPLYRNLVAPWSGLEYLPLWDDAPPQAVLRLQPPG